MRRSRWVLIVLSFGAMFGVSGWIVWSQWARGTDLPSIPLWAHALTFGLVGAEILARTLKIRLSAAALSIPLTFGTSLRVCLGGDFAGNVTPGRSGGEPARFLVLVEARMPTTNILLVLFLELLLELGSLIVLSFGFWFFFRGSGTTLGLIIGVIVGYASFVIGLGVAGYVLSRRNASGPTPAWVKRLGLHAGHWRRIQLSLRHLRGGVQALKSASQSWMLASFVASVVHVALRLSWLPVLVWSIDRTVELAPLVLWPLILLYGSVAAPAPGGGGVVEYGFAKAFEGTLTPAVLATALIWWRFYSYYLYILLGSLGAGSTVMRALRPDRSTAPSDAH
jgi:uncharacterized protein (TIRG00374 family)